MATALVYAYRIVLGFIGVLLMYNVGRFFYLIGLPIFASAFLALSLLCFTSFIWNHRASKWKRLPLFINKKDVILSSLPIILPVLFALVAGLIGVTDKLSLWSMTIVCLIIVCQVLYMIVTNIYTLDVRANPAMVMWAVAQRVAVGTFLVLTFAVFMNYTQKARKETLTWIVTTGVLVLFGWFSYGLIRDGKRW